MVFPGIPAGNAWSAALGGSTSLNAEARVVKEAQQQVGAAAKPCEAAIGLLADLRLGLRRRTLHVILDVAVTALLGV